MTSEELEKIADEAIIIVDGFAFNKDESGAYRILNLYNPDEACVINSIGDLVATDMNDIRTLYVQSLFIRNKEFLED